MAEALALAKEAGKRGEVPVGAVIEKDGLIIGTGYNLTETLKDPTAHAEILAIRDAASKLGGWRLLDCNMYVTCEPCAMCAGALVLARIKKLVIGVMDPKSGACGSVFNVPGERRLNHFIEVETGILADECQAIMKSFFKEKRKKSTEDVNI